MATTHIHRASQGSRAYHRTEERNEYAAVWGILGIAIVAAIAYGYYAGERAMTYDQNTPIVESSDGMTSSMASVPDTMTIESVVIPADGIE